MRGDYDIDADSQESEGGIYHLHGHVVIEVFDATFKADEAEYDENTNIFKAHGNVSYRNYKRNEVIYCDRAEYNTETARGTFYHVKGYTKTKVVAGPGMLTTQEPFYFEGEWAEKIEEKYILYDGMITDCHIPHPWWTMNAPNVGHHSRRPRHHARRRLPSARHSAFLLPLFLQGAQEGAAQERFSDA